MTLDELMAEYWDQPAFCQVHALKEINDLRAEQNLPPLDSKLQPPKGPKPIRKPPVRDLTRAREIYAAYKIKAAELRKHQDYADAVVKATEGFGMTLVEPLATMGCGGGPLLCDYCKKPIILEGGNFHGQYADAAWKKHPVKGWKSYIKGGMMVEIQSNFTIRIYHGYQYNKQDCCEIAAGLDQIARSKHITEMDSRLRDDLLAVIEEEDKLNTYNDLFSVMFQYDPGLGVNRPGGA